jgi:glycosyltransferase involved in cell wall biosynthesis
MKLPITVITLTLNEEYHLPDFLDHLRDRVEAIFIVDSLSSDQTVSIALEKGANVIQRPFTNFGDQWNFALRFLPVSTSWVMKLDPDERLTEELFASIKDALTNPDTNKGFGFMRRLWFFGTPLHVLAPVVRVWKAGSCRFSDVIVNEHPIISGSVKMLDGILEHHDSVDLHAWLDKQNRYSTMEAIASITEASLSAEPRLFGSPMERRMFFKKHFFRIPFRYHIQFIYDFFRRQSFRDGKVGYEWTRLRIQITRWQELKVREMKVTGRRPQLPRAATGPFDPRITASELQSNIIQESGQEFTIEK